MVNHMTQHEKIMDYLNRRSRRGMHYVLTPMKAFQKLGITKLSTRIGELIERGNTIYKIPVCKRRKDGTTIRYMSYTLDAPEGENVRIYQDSSEAD